MDISVLKFKICRTEAPHIFRKND